jgi:hypothetical protein
MLPLVDWLSVLIDNCGNLSPVRTHLWTQHGSHHCLAFRTPDYATPVDQQFQVEYDPGQIKMNEESESKSPAHSPVRFSKRPRHVIGELLHQLHTSVYQLDISAPVTHVTCASLICLHHLCRQSQLLLVCLCMFCPAISTAVPVAEHRCIIRHGDHLASLRSPPPPCSCAAHTGVDQDSEATSQPSQSDRSQGEPSTSSRTTSGGQLRASRPASARGC